MVVLQVAEIAAFNAIVASISLYTYLYVFIHIQFGMWHANNSNCGNKTIIQTVAE